MPDHTMQGELLSPYITATTEKSNYQLDLQRHACVWVQWNFFFILHSPKTPEGFGWMAKDVIYESLRQMDKCSWNMKRCRPDTQPALGRGKGGFHPGSNLSRDNTQARVVSALTLWIALMSCSIAALSWSIDQACKYGTLYSVIRMPRYPMSETGELYVFQRSMYTFFFFFFNIYTS